MCGRFFYNSKDFIDHPILNKYKTSDKNPSEKIAVLSPKLSFKYWGIKINRNLVINARVENYQNNYFRNFKPCVILSSGYYEWNAKKERYFFHHPNKKYMAGLFLEDNVVVLTQQANNSIHNRMPILLNFSEAKQFINNNKLCYNNDGIIIEYPKFGQLSIFDYSNN